MKIFTEKYIKFAELKLWKQMHECLTFDINDFLFILKINFTI